MLCEIGRACNCNETLTRRRGVRPASNPVVTHADRTVDTVLYKVDRLVTNAQHQVDVRVSRVELADRGDDHQPAERPRQFHFELSSRRTDTGK